MTWNYRIILEETEHGNIYSIAEVYYKEDATYLGYCERVIIGDDLEDLRKGYELMEEAFQHLPINVKEFKLPEDLEQYAE